MPRAARVLLALAVVAVAASLGFAATARLAPERLQGEVRGWLERATGQPVEIASLRVRIGMPVELHGDGLVLWNGALTAQHASARIDVISLLVGRPRVASLRLDGAHLRIERLPGGGWWPPIFGKPSTPHPEPALEPLRVIEGAFRLLLARPFLADRLIVRRSRVSLVHPSPTPGGEPVRLELQSVAGRLLHSRLFGDARLFVRLRLFSDGIDRGVLEWDGSRAPDASIQVTMAATGFDLAALAPYVRGVREQARLAGAVDGVIDYATPHAGAGRVELDLVARDFSASLGREPAQPLAVDRLSLRMGIDVGESRVALRGARISAGGLDFGLDGSIERPLGEGSRTRLSLELAEVPLDPERARALAGWLPETGRQRFLFLVERLRSGRLVRGEVGGEASLGRWRDSLAGHFDRLPDGFELSMRVEDVAMQVDEEDRLDRLSGELAFREDTLRVEGASAELNGGPLPRLDLTFQGLSLILASPPERSPLASGAQALVGVTPLWEVLRREPDAATPGSPPPQVELWLDQLSHPALLWPISDVAVELQLETGSEGLRIDVREARWAGAAIEGEVDWRLGPERRLGVRLVATPPTQTERVPSPELESSPGFLGEQGARSWASGRLRVGPVAGERWRHRELRARFEAVGGGIRLDRLAIDLEPDGLLVGSGELDLSQADRVPYRTQLAIRDGDAGALTRVFGADPDLAAGRVAVGVRLAGTLVPGRPLLHDAYGRIGLSARNGTLRRSVPPMLALALASGAFNPFSTVERIRYERIESRMALSQGVLSSEALELDGPDLRLFASGAIDLREQPAALDLEVVLFLFRQLDRAIELIPLVNVLLLGENENLLAAYFELVGTWEEPIASAKPLRTIEEGPTDLLTRRLPSIVTRGMKALGGLLKGSEPEAPGPAGVDAPRPAARFAQ
jgi:hypothetical protein